MNKKPVAQFTCTRFPYLQIRDLKFKAGILLVYSERDAELIRGIEDFGVHVTELPLCESAHVEVKQANTARVGMQATRQEPAEPPPDSPKDDADNSVLVLGGGWYEHQGKKYRKADLPEGVRNLV